MNEAAIETRLEAIASRIETSQTALEAAILDQSTLLRLFLDRLDKLLESQVPKDESGPTMQEILAEIVLRLGENTALLRKLDRHLIGSRSAQEGGAHPMCNNANHPEATPAEDAL